MNSILLPSIQSLWPGAGARGLRRYSDTSGRPASQNRHGRSAALLTPTRGPSTPTCSSPSVSRTGLWASNRSIPLSSMVIPSAEHRLPGPRASAAGRTESPRRVRATSMPGLDRRGPQQHRARDSVRSRTRRSRRRECRGCGRCTAARPDRTSPCCARRARGRSATRRRATARRAARRMPRPRRSSRSRRARSVPRPAVAGPRSTGSTDSRFARSPRAILPAALDRPTSGERLFIT